MYAQTILETIYPVEDKKMIHIPKVSGRRGQILLSLGNHGPMSKYQVAKREDISYPVVHLCMKELESKRLVLMLERRRGKKGASTLLYDITKTGLFLLAATEKNFHLPLYAESHKENDPTFFKIWKHYEAKKSQDAMEKIFRLHSEMALREGKAESIRSNAGKTYLQNLAGYGGALTLDDYTKVLSLENMDRYFAAIVQNEGLYGPLIQGVQRSLNDYRLKTREKENFLEMLLELHGLVQEERKAGVKEDEIEHRLMKAIEGRLLRMMNLDSVPH